MASGDVVVHRRMHPFEDALQQLGGMSRAQGYKLVNAGQLQTVKVGRRRYVTEDELSAFIERMKAAA